MDLIQVKIKKDPAMVSYIKLIRKFDPSLTVGSVKSAIEAGGFVLEYDLDRHDVLSSVGKKDAASRSAPKPKPQPSEAVAVWKGGARERSGWHFCKKCRSKADFAPTRWRRTWTGRPTRTELNVLCQNGAVENRGPVFLSGQGGNFVL